MKVNYHSCKGLRRRGHRFKTHGTVYGAGNGRIHMTRLKDTGGRTVITAAAGSLMRASINLVQKRAIPALRAFSHSRNDRKADYIHCSRLNQRRVDHIQSTRRLQPPATHQKITAMLHGS